MTDSTTEAPTFTPLAAPADAAEGLTRMRQPFPANQIGLLPKQQKREDQDKGRCEPGTKYSANGKYCGGWHARSVHLDYVGHAALTDRLLDADPAWSWEPVAFGPDGLPALDRNGGLWLRLTVQGVTRLGYGDSQGKTGPNAVKEAIGDGLRNAGMRFGAALDLWHKGDLHEQKLEQGEPQQEAPATPRAGANQSRPIPAAQRPAQAPAAAQQGAPAPQDWEAQQYADSAETVQTAEQVLEVYQAARHAGVLGAEVTVRGRRLTLREALTERGTALKADTREEINPTPLDTP